MNNIHRTAAETFDIILRINSSHKKDRWPNAKIPIEQKIHYGEIENAEYAKIFVEDTDYIRVAVVTPGGMAKFEFVNYYGEVLFTRWNSAKTEVFTGYEGKRIERSV